MNRFQPTGLDPVVADKTKQLIRRAYETGIMIVITQGYRSIEYQNQLYAQGRTPESIAKGEKIVTNAPGGRSFHNYGVAVDFALLLPDGRTASWDTKRDDNRDGVADWNQVVSIAKSLGFEWGGDWKTFVDLPHFQMTFGLSLNDYAAGKRPDHTQGDDNVIQIDGTVNGKAVTGFMKDGTVYVPLRAVSEGVGAVVKWDNTKKTFDVSGEVK